ncbi:MAG: hypothetical protein ABR577_19785, partial [Pyrinomonadaceae bacterium]
MNLSTVDVRPTITKFGGTSVEDARAFERVRRIVYDQRAARPVVVVVSAMSRVTDALLKSVVRASDGDAAEAAQLLSEHFERHLNVAHALLRGESRATAETTVESARHEIAELLRA